MSTATLSIDLDAIAANWRALDRLSDSGTQTGAVVKADAYGLGADRVAQALGQGGRAAFLRRRRRRRARRCARRSAPGRRSACCRGHMPGDTDMIRDLDLTPMLNSLDQVTRHLEALPGHPFGVQLDTGMNRLGMEADEWAAVRRLRA